MISIIKYVLAIFILMIMGCNSIEITSYWKDKEIKIDGNNEEWDSKTWLLKDVKNVSFGFMNDADNLYLLLTIADKALQRQIAFSGLMVWFDRKGGDEKKFGIHYPLPKTMDITMAPRMQRPDMKPGIDTTFQFPEQFSDELEIFGPMENEHTRLSMQETGGIEIALRHSQGSLVYEMKVPITDKGPKPYAIASRVGEIIGVGFETGRIGIPGINERPPMDGSFNRPRGGGFPGGKPPADIREKKEPLKIWLKLKLVSN